jgi:hypothetical protein
MADKISVTTPVGRLVQGSLYRPNDKNFDGKPLVDKQGQPRVQYFFGIAIPKIAGHTHWSQTEWGKVIWQVGHTAFPQAAQRPDFSWKIEDGDSAIPNKRNRKPCENDGWRGNWIVKFSNGFAPTIYKQNGNDWMQITEVDAVKPGYYIQVAFTVDGNGQQNNPGVYLNPQGVCFRAYGEEISFGPNVEEMGFGAAPLPAGASTVPFAAPIMPVPPAAPIAAPAAPPVPVYPQPAFLQVPPPAAQVNPISVAPVAVQSIPVGLPAPPPIATIASPSNHQMTPKAGGVSYEAYQAAGWSDAQLIANGLMLA